MRVDVLIIIISGVMVVYLLWCKLSEDFDRDGDLKLSLKRDKSLIKDITNSQTERYVVSGGLWTLCWSSPFSGNSIPFSYNYEIHMIDETKGTDRVILQGTNIADTNVILDMTKFPSKRDPSDRYMAIVKTSNVKDLKAFGRLDFVLYDTPSIQKINTIMGDVVYPTPSTGNIFYKKDILPKKDIGSYNISPLHITFDDDVPRKGIDATISVGGKTYNATVNMGSYQSPSNTWLLTWDESIIIGSNIPVIMTISSTNQAGTAIWSYTKATPDGKI